MDEKYGQILWKEYPENANKGTTHLSLSLCLVFSFRFLRLFMVDFNSAVFSELLSRVLGLEGDVCDPVECRMCVTVFQFAAFFLQYEE